MSGKSFCCGLIHAFLAGGTFSVIFYSTFYLHEKINERFSRLEEKHESCED